MQDVQLPRHHTAYLYGQSKLRQRARGLLPRAQSGSCGSRLDADESGALSLEEIVEGLTKMRGEAQRIDVIAALLGIRVIQDQ